MADDGKLRDQMHRGDEAARVLESPLVKEFFAKIKEQIRREWETSSAADKDEREHQWRLFQAVSLLEDLFKQTVSTGKTALKQLTSKETG